MDHCISVFLHEAKEKIDELKYRVYVTDCLRMLTETTARCVMSGSNVSYIGVRYADTLDKFRPKKESEKTGDEIALEIIKKAGLSLKGKEVTEE